EGQLLRLAGAAPAGPVGGRGEGPLRRALDRDQDRVRHRSILPSAPDGMRQVRVRPSVACRSCPTSRAIASTSDPSRPRASTSALATITPAAPAFAIARTWAGRL